MTLRFAALPEFVFRVGRRNPWEIHPPSGSNRFDISDSSNPVFTVYTGESQEAAFAEILGPFRPDLAVIAAMGAIHADVGDPVAMAGRVSVAWRASRRIGTAKVRDTVSIVDITLADTIAELRTVPALVDAALECGFTDIDDAALKSSGPNGRLFTQSVAAHLYERDLSGIRYGSRLGAPYCCVAGFIPLSCNVITESEFISELLATEEIRRDNTALVEVARIFGLTVE